ncbi:biotin-dependent carboxyltransferase family protein [Colwellia psychrerythraea]|uniref:Urea amidolyase related protein n=1 Tax=Colwellia psychrerythraea TaxID=28229 RepID=A0A099KI59_COLPS|nr:biotin-dependent carboxyltransferase family protein [Colwellia psychrerythraea]KGJ89945.1 urea amidolyase related protein [Colwellia psychrerythraea]
MKSHNKSTGATSNANETALGLLVTNAGVLSLIQDAGRYGAFNLGLTNGGPADPLAFYWANKLCGNALNTTSIEISLGGLELLAQVNCVIAVTGAAMPLTINGHKKLLWRSYLIKAGDKINLGYTSQGVRCYLAVAGGFDIKPSFGSTATVCRESVGGINGDKIVTDDLLPCQAIDKSRSQLKLLMLAEHGQPKYSNEVVLRTILSYQHQSFSAIGKRLFFSCQYHVSKHWDRMGYRLQGRAIKPALDGILSEGICYGAVQLPADGQPIILLNDRQTIGGYPKIGAVISQDCAKLSQLRQGDSVRFEPISMSQADNLFHLNISRLKQTQLISCN